VHEFLAIAAHPRIYDPPPLEDALDQVAAWIASASRISSHHRGAIHMHRCTSLTFEHLF